MSSRSARVHNKSVTNAVFYDERNFDTSIPTQSSSDNSSEDESCFGILAPSQASSTASQLHIHGDRYSENTETVQDSKPDILIPSGTIDHPSMDSRKVDCYGISKDMSLITVEPHHGSDMQSREEHRANLDFLITTRPSSSTMEPCPMVSRDGNIRSTEIPSVNPFQGASNVKIKDTTFITTGGNATFIQFGDGQFTEIQRNSICDYIVNLTVLPDIDLNLKKHILTQSIISLPRAEAEFSDYQTSKKSGPCFEGTRVALLREMADWVTSLDESRMYVLSGLAGIGKSTVAYTIASRASDLGLLGASFFFSRDEDDRKNAKRFFTTIAYQLCVYNEIFAKTIGDVLLTERGSAATTKDPREQLQVLILEPLRSIVQPRTRPILVVIDALDECDEADEHAVFNGLCQLVRDLPSFKVILTTRPQPSVEAFLSSHGGHKLLRLQDIENKVVDSDIRLYLNYSLSLEQARKRHPRWQWYASSEEIDSLVHAAGRLFIIASTAVRYILDKTAYNPENQMKKLLCAFAQARTPFKDLDQFYTVILRNVVPESCDDDISSIYQSVVGAIILIQHPLPISTLTHVINIDVNEIRAVLDKLQSVILVGDDDVPRIYHKSFPDYVMDQGRCKDPRLQIYPRIIHTQIATHCFEMMDKYLKYNILGLGNPARFMKNEDSLKENRITDEQLEEKIPQQLRYGCVYWDNHLGESNVADVNLMDILEKFVNEHMLHWLEVLSLIGKLDSAHYAIGVVLELVQSTSRSLDLDQLLSDALCFISKFYEIIKRSALHTYYSALAFTPTDSALYDRYNKAAVGYTCVISGGPEKWDAFVAALSQVNVNTIKFSLDSSLFVSWSEKTIRKQGKLKIWNSTTGTLISVIPGHKFAITNDFSTIASSEDSTISYYNVNGSARGVMFTTSSTIKHLALSSESNRIAAALDDGTVLLWDSINFKSIDSFKDFKGEVFQFSPTGTRLAYSSSNRIVKLRDGISGRSVADLQYELFFKPELEFSADGSRIAALSYADYHLRLWNSESGALIDDVSECTDDYYLAISATGSLLATAFKFKVKLWRENHGRLAQIKVLEHHPESITFSVDNILAIATKSDIRLYDVKTHSFISTLPLKMHSFISTSMSELMTFSPDCTRLAITICSGWIYLWDSRGMDTSGSILKNKSNTLTALALSRDCSQLACGFEDGTMKLWRTDPTTGTKQRNSSLGLRSKIKAFLPRIFGQFRHNGKVTTLGISPDGKLLASGSDDKTIKLWNSKDGLLRATLKMPTKLQSVALSNTMLVAGFDFTVTLWNLDASRKDTFTYMESVWRVSIAENDALIAIADENSCVSLFDVVNKTIIATFDVPLRSYTLHTMTFLPNNSHLVVQSYGGVVLSLNLINKRIIKGPTLEHLIQLPNIPIWHGVPIWHCKHKMQHYISALFPQHEKPVPVLWIPKQISVALWTQGSSMIALGCNDGRIILIRLPTCHVV